MRPGPCDERADDPRDDAACGHADTGSGQAEPKPYCGGPLPCLQGSLAEVARLVFEVRLAIPQSSFAIYLAEPAPVLSERPEVLHVPPVGT